MSTPRSWVDAMASPRRARASRKASRIASSSRTREARSSTAAIVEVGPSRRRARRPVAYAGWHSTLSTASARRPRTCMPKYEYACKSCGEHIEVKQSFTDDPLTECPACGGAAAQGVLQSRHRAARAPASTAPTTAAPTGPTASCRRRRTRTRSRPRPRRRRSRRPESTGGRLQGRPTRRARSPGVGLEGVGLEGSVGLEGVESSSKASSDSGSGDVRRRRGTSASGRGRRGSRRGPAGRRATPAAPRTRPAPPSRLLRRGAPVGRDRHLRRHRLLPLPRPPARKWRCATPVRTAVGQAGGGGAGRPAGGVPRPARRRPRVPAPPGQLPGQRVGAAPARRAPDPGPLLGRVAAAPREAGGVRGRRPAGRPHQRAGGHVLRRPHAGPRVLRRPLLPRAAAGA